VKRVGIETLPIASLKLSKLSANRENMDTFRRLKRELSEHGLLDLPVVQRTSSGALKVLSGAHRTIAWAELGHTDIEAIIVEGELSPEDEFNLVNNLNAVRGEISPAKVQSIVKQQRLRADRLDLYKFPASRLSLSSLPVSEDAMQRQARIRRLAFELVSKVATIMEDGAEAAVVCFQAGTVPVAVLRLPLSQSAAQKDIPGLKKRLEALLEEWVNGS
jgi:ParB-like chromosome segregation protein Spo0J